MSTLYEQYRDTLRRAHTAARTGHHREARDAYAEAARLIDGRAAPWVGIGSMELELGRPGVALAAFETALAIDASDPAALDGRARAEAQATSRPARRTRSQRSSPAAPVAPPDDGEAIRALARRWASAEEAADVDGLLDVAVALARADRPAAATTAARDALTLAPGDPNVHRVLAWLERTAGEVAAARRTTALIERYFAAIDDPDGLEQEMAEAERRGDIAALVELAERHLRRDRPRSALDASFAALRLAPGDREVHLSIVRSHLAMGLRAHAVDELARLARLAALDEDDAGLARIAAVVNGDLLPGGVTDPF
jgi:tetratricopeptide (TPR) repeat protein